MGLSWPNDRHFDFQDPAKKAEAEVMFMKIQESCNLLSEHRKSKSKNNQKETEDSELWAVVFYLLNIFIQVWWP